jgi:hypothetical protein
MRIRIWIFERLLYQPCVISLSQLRRKTFNVKVHQLVVARLMGSKGLHKHPGVNRCLLHALDRQYTGSAFQGVELVHQPIAFSSPRR